MAMDQKQKKKVAIAVGAGTFMVLLVGLMLYFLFFSGGDETPAESQLGASDTMAPGNPTITPQQLAQGGVGSVSINPQSIQFPNDQPGTQQISLRAEGGPVEIADVVIPSTDADAISVTNVDCPSPPTTLQPGAACTATVTWNGLRTVNSTITVRTNSAGAPGGAVAMPAVVTVSGVSTRPNQVASLPSQGGYPAPPGATSGPGAPVPAPAPVPVGPSPREQIQSEYLQARRGAAPQIARAGQLQPAARSQYTSWNSIGVQSVTSSRPTDMSRVLTPDKPITAVISNPIDTRSVVTAVAVVDRDIYGNNGRTIIVPRGSRLIGRAGVEDTRVSINWVQLIRPDGARFIMESLSGDHSGRGGVPGRVNERNLERYGSVLLASAITGGIAALTGAQESETTGTNGSSSSRNTGAIITEQVGQALDRVSQDYFNRRRNIPIQIVVPAGTRITVWAATDLRLRPANERDAPPQQAQQANQSVFQGGQGFNPGNYEQQYQQPATPQGQPGQQGGQPESPNGRAELQVGRVDSSGRYIPPGGVAPPPGPLTTPQGNNQQAQPSTQMPTTRAPWDRR